MDDDNEYYILTKTMAFIQNQGTNRKIGKYIL